eukprot:3801436-Rhodomonas_salina.2
MAAAGIHGVDPGVDGGRLTWVGGWVDRQRVAMSYYKFQHGDTVLPKRFPIGLEDQVREQRREDAMTRWKLERVEEGWVLRSSVEIASVSESVSVSGAEGEQEACCRMEWRHGLASRQRGRKDLRQKAASSSAVARETERVCAALKSAHRIGSPQPLWLDAKCLGNTRTQMQVGQAGRLSPTACPDHTASQNNITPHLSTT